MAASVVLQNFVAKFASNLNYILIIALVILVCCNIFIIRQSL